MSPDGPRDRRGRGRLAWRPRRPGVGGGSRRARLPTSGRCCRNGLRVVTQPMPHRAIGGGRAVRRASARVTRTGLTPASRTCSSTSSSRARARYPEAGAPVGGDRGLRRIVNASTDRELTVYTSRVPADARGAGAGGGERARPRRCCASADLVGREAGDRRRDPHVRRLARRPRLHACSTSCSSAIIRSGARSPGRRAACVAPARGRAEPLAALVPARANLVLAVAGAIDHGRCDGAARRWWADDAALPADRASSRSGAPSPAAAGSMRVSHRDLSQGNLCLGMPGSRATIPTDGRSTCSGRCLATG